MRVRSRVYHHHHHQPPAPSRPAKERGTTAGTRSGSQLNASAPGAIPRILTKRGFSSSADDVPRRSKKGGKKNTSTTAALGAGFVVSFPHRAPPSAAPPPPLPLVRVRRLSRLFFFSFSSSIHINHPGERARERSRLSPPLARFFVFVSARPAHCNCYLNGFPQLETKRWIMGQTYQNRRR